MIIPATLIDGSPMPTATNTGLTTSASALTAQDASGSGYRCWTPGQTFNGVCFTGYVTVNVPNVTFNNCKFIGQGDVSGYFVVVYQGAMGTVFNHCEFDSSQTAQCPLETFADTKVLNCYFHDCVGNAVMQLGANLVFQGNYMERFGWNAAGLTSNPDLPSFLNFSGVSHTETVYLGAGTTSLISHNCFNTPNYETVNGIHYALNAGPIFGPQPNNALGPVTIDNNFFVGSGDLTPLPPVTGFALGYMLGAGGYQVTNNIFGPLVVNNQGYIYSGYVGSPWNWYNNKDINGKVIPVPTGLSPAGSSTPPVPPVTPVTPVPPVTPVTTP
jgi:hypothetical protein